MKNFLHPRTAPVLEDLARADSLLIFDFDGTLAPIVADPQCARMRLTTRTLLGRVARLYPTAVLSGRRRADLAAHLSGVRSCRLVGNHGAEPESGSPRLAQWRSAVRRWRERLQPQLAELEGVIFEDKGLSLSVHYRTARPRATARDRIGRMLGELRGARIVPGKCVFNVVPASAPDKGSALRQLIRAQRYSMALFVGDDITDEDVFRLRAPDVIGVRVGRSRTSAAQYYIPSQAEIDRLLRRLIDARGDTRGRAGRTRKRFGAARSLVVVPRGGPARPARNHSFASGTSAA